MKKLLALTRVSLTGVLFSPGKGTGKKGGTILVYSLLGLYLAGFSGVFTAGLYYTLGEFNLQTLIPVFFFIGASVLVLISAIFSGSGFLYQPKDLQTLFALPVSHATVMISKFLALYLYSLVTAAMLMLPSGIVYLVLDGAGPLSYIGLLISTLFQPLIPLAIGCLLSYFVGLITRRMKHKNLLSIIIGIVFFTGVMFMSQNGDGIFIYLQENGGIIYEALLKWYFPAAITSNAIEGSVLYMLLFMVVSVAPFAVIFPIMSKRYASIVAAYSQTPKKEKYVLTASHRSTKLRSCFRKELSRVISSANYFLNSCAGMLMLVVFGIMLITQDNFEGLFADGSSVAIMIITMMAIFACTMNSTTACAISIEGKAIWIYKTAPVDTMTIFNAKTAVNIMLITPLTVAFTIVMSIVMKANAVDAVFAVILPVVCIIYASLMGLIINLAKPKLNWTSEIQVIKQSSNIMLMMLEGIGFTILMALALILPVALLDLPFAIAAGICTVIMVAVCAILYNTLKKWGVRKFEQLYI